MLRRSLSTALPAAAAAAWLAWWAWRLWPVRGISWHFFPTGSHLLWHGSGFQLYADHPELQIGPLPLAVVGLLAPLSASAARDVALVVMTLLGAVAFAALYPLVAGPRRNLRMLVVAIPLAPAWTVLSVR